MTTVEAMERVNAKLLAQDVLGAQAEVLAIEREHATLPSSVFEAVLAQAVHTNQLTPDYSAWMSRAYGRRQYQELLTDLLTTATRRT